MAHGGALFLLPVGPLEDHGPHLPAGVDWFTAKSLTQELATRLEEQVDEVVVLPPLALGASLLYTLGCLRLRVKTMGQVVEQLGRELAGEGVRQLLVITTHGAISHLAALDRACARVERSTKMKMASPCHKIILDFLSGRLRGRVEQALGRKVQDSVWQELAVDYHAGAWETALMLRYHPHLVKPFHNELPPHPRSTSKRDAWRGLTTHRGYFGSPALATLELGDAAAQVLVDCGVEQVERFLARGPVKPSRAGWPWLAGAAVLAGLWVSCRKAKQSAKTD